jgi:predicted permease
MRNWQAYVRKRLPLAGLRPAREARLVGEVAAQLEDLYRDAVLRGASDEEADRLAADHVADWSRLAADLAEADPAATLPAFERRNDRAREGGSPLRPFWSAFAALHHDLGHAARMLARRPGLAAVLVLTLALGIGANSAIFSAVDAILLRPLPYDGADRLVYLSEDNRAEGHAHWEISLQNWNDWQQQARVLDGSAAWFYQSATLTGGFEARRLRAARITAGAFRLLGVAPVAGRDFVPEDADENADVVILSHHLWQQLFAGAAGAAGRTIRLDGRPHIIAGVMPPAFQFPSPEVDLWRPMPTVLLLEGRQRGRHFANAIARVKPGVTLEQARGDLNRVAGVLAATYPDTNAGWTVGIEWLQESMVGESRALLLLAWAAAVLVLLIACSNAAGILVTEAAARDREIAVRTALGAGRRRIAAQMLTEALLVASVSGVMGVGLATLGLRALSRLVSGAVPLAERMALDWRVVAFTTLTVLAVAVVAGIVPAIKASSVTSAAVLKESGRTTITRRRRSFRQVFVAGQVSVALVLLVSAGLIGRSVMNLWRANTGFDPRGVVTFAYSLPVTADTTREAVVAVHGQVVSRLAAAPGVQAAGLTLVLPLEGDVEVRGFGIEGRPPAEMANASVMARPVSTGFLNTLEVPLLQGRLFTEFDRGAGEQVAIISRATRARYWPSGNPLGSHVTIVRQQWTVVGVVEDMPTNGLDTAAKPVVYVPLDRWPIGLRSMRAVVRTAGDPSAVLGGIRQAMAEVSREAPIFAVQTLDDLCGESIARQRFAALILGLFALVALVLAVVGIYGTVSNFVVQRTHEIGIRMAVGASPRDILRATVGEGVLLAAAGVVVGAAAAAASARLLASLLFGVSNTDPATYLAMSALLLFLVAVASWVPGRRAMGIDPVTALRSE